MTTFIDYLKELFRENLPEDPFLRQLREKAWVATSLPGRKEDGFEYLPLRELYVRSYPRALTYVDEDYIRQALLPECPYALVFVNGHYQPQCSTPPPHVVVSPMPEALTAYGQFLKNRLTKLLEGEQDPFALLNTALHGPGAFIYVPPKWQHAAPIQILHVYTGTAFPRIQVFVGAGAELKCVTRSVAWEDSAFWTSSLTDFAIEEQAKVHHVDYGDMPSDNWHFQAWRASLKGSARFESIACQKGAKVERNDYRVSLAGENCSAHLQGLALLKGARQAHTRVLMQHLAPHCQSMQSFKKVLHDYSQSSFEGKIYVHQKAQKTAAYQLNKNLLLSKGAIANSKPNLEIFADDVKASHGSTIGQPDEKALHYLRSRGLSLEEAKALLVSGFCQEFVSQIPYPSIRDWILDLL